MNIEVLGGKHLKGLMTLRTKQKKSRHLKSWLPRVWGYWVQLTFVMES